MKTIGLLGGMSWESTASYYRAINEGVKARLGGLHSAKLVLYSVDFHEIEQLQHQGRWSETAELLSSAATSIQAAGADALMICTNTMHKVAGEIEQSISIPLIHIADATAKRIVSDGLDCVGLLGTRFTMAQEFYKGRLTDQFGLEVLVPDSAQQDLVHNVIYQELCAGVIRDESKQRYLEIIDSLQARGAQAVILGCTEIALLVQSSDTDMPLYDTTQIHADAAVDYALAE